MRLIPLFFTIDLAKKIEKLLDHKGIGNVDEEGPHQGYNDESLGSGAEFFRHCGHIGDRRGGGPQG